MKEISHSHAMSCLLISSRIIFQVLKKYIFGVMDVAASSDCRLQYVFCPFSYFPRNLELTWNYGEAHHFKGPHDGIGGAIKRRVFSDITTQKVVIQNASLFCSYASNVSHVKLIYLVNQKSKFQMLMIALMFL